MMTSRMKVMMNSSVKLYFFLFMILLVLQILDFSMTVWIINTNPDFVEGNPIIARGLEKGQHLLILFGKIVLSVAFFLLGVVSLKEKRLDTWFQKFYIALFIGVDIFMAFVVSLLGVWRWVLI